MFINIIQFLQIYIVVESPKLGVSTSCNKTNLMIKNGTEINMTGLERTLLFINGESVDHPPFQVP